MKGARLFLLAASLLAAVPAVGPMPRTPACWSRRRTRAPRAKKYDEAVAAIHKAIEIQPSNDRYLMFASEIDRRAGHFADGSSSPRGHQGKRQGGSVLRPRRRQRLRQPGARAGPGILP